MRSIFCTFRSELKETTASQEATETEPDPRMMQSIEEHREIRKGEATVMPVEEPRKRRRVCNMGAESCQKRKERTRGKTGSRRKSTAACRKVSRRAKLAWWKRNVFRNVRNLEKCKRRKEFAAARIKTTRCAKVARRKGRSYEGPSVEQGRRKKTRNKIARGTRIFLFLSNKYLWNHPIANRVIF
jgi:hypothetical protein